jgi:hypothetical protein
LIENSKCSENIRIVKIVAKLSHAYFAYRARLFQFKASVTKKSPSEEGLVCLGSLWLGEIVAGAIELWPHPTKLNCENFTRGNMDTGISLETE